MTPDPDAEPAPPAPPPPCWRCGLPADPDAPDCPHCSARPRRLGPESAPTSAPADDDWRPLRAVLLAYLAFLGTSVVWGWIVWFGPPMGPDDLRAGTIVVETVDAGITVALAFAVGRLPGAASRLRNRLLAWLTAPPALAALLGLNFAYFEVMRRLLPPQLVLPPEPITAVTVVTDCLQPAVVEELFFRYFALGVLRRITGPHAAIWTTAALFAVAHLYNPLGMPYLFVCGAVLGYFRTVGGGLAVPVLMHFFHNLAVLWYEANR